MSLLPLDAADCYPLSEVSFGFEYCLHLLLLPSTQQLQQIAESVS